MVAGPGINQGAAVVIYKHHDLPVSQAGRDSHGYVTPLASAICANMYASLVAVKLTTACFICLPKSGLVCIHACVYHAHMRPFTKGNFMAAELDANHNQHLQPQCVDSYSGLWTHSSKSTTLPSSSLMLRR